MAALERAFVLTTPAELLNCDYGLGSIPSTPKSASVLGTSASMTSLLEDLAQVCSMVTSHGTTAAQKIGEPIPLANLDFGLTIIKCVTHIEVLQTIREVALTQLVQKPRMSMNSPVAVVRTPSAPSTSPAKPPHICLAITILPIDIRYRILDLLYDSYSIARAFNENYNLRQAIFRKGLVQNMPNLVRQETISLSSYIQILFAIYRLEGDPDDAASLGLLTRTEQEMELMRQGVNMLIRNTLDVIERFVVLTVDQQHNGREISLWSPVVIMIFRELLSFERWWGATATQVLALTASDAGDEAKKVYPKCLMMKRQLPKFFRLGIRMMSVERLDVRQVLQEFMERVGDELFGMFIDK
jgi:brefeldin A-inhibited guanine nucleotide-exchange protein